MNLGPVEALPVPLQRGGRRDWALVQAGEDHSRGLHADGSLDCWGDTYPAPKGMRFRAVGVGYSNTCAIRDDGTLWCWGDTCRRQGTGPLICWGDHPVPQGSSAKPGQIGRERDWVSVAVGFGYACGIRADGALWCWGSNGAGELGKVGEGFWPQPTRIAGGPWSQVAVIDDLGGNHTCGVRTDHSLWCWGEAGAGQLGAAPPTPGDAAALATPDEVTEVVETPDLFLVARLIERQVPVERTFEQERGQLAARVSREIRSKDFDERVRQLRLEARVRIDEAALERIVVK